MSESSPRDVTLTLLDLERSGPADAVTERLFQEVYGELRRIAGKLMAGERDNHTLQPTALVHEAYLRLVKTERVSWQGRAHFLRVAARAMRRILVNHARDRARIKRGGGWTRVTLNEELAGSQDRTLEVLSLDQALEKLSRKDERMAQVVELRVFAGMRVQDVAHVLAVSKRTVDSDWQIAKRWLTRELLRETRS